jgi:hypothetical protein
VFSARFGYAAQFDRNAGQVRVFARQGDAFLPMGDRGAASLGASKPGELSRVLFVPGSRLLAVQFADQHAVLIDPADPQAPPRSTSVIPGDWDSAGRPADELSLGLAGYPAPHPDTRLLASGEEAVSLDISQPNTRADGYHCESRPPDRSTLLCWGTGDHAVVATVRIATTGTFRLLGRLSGDPFTGAVMSPDGKRLLVQRDDGIYVLPITGGTPKRVLGDPTVLSWS